MSQGGILTMCSCYSPTDTRVQVILLDKTIISMPLSATSWLLQYWTMSAESRLEYYTWNVSLRHMVHLYVLLSPTLYNTYTTTGSYSHHICDHLWIVEETTVPDNSFYMDDIVINLYRLSLSCTSSVPPLLTQLWFPGFEYKLHL